MTLIDNLHHFHKNAGTDLIAELVQFNTGESGNIPANKLFYLFSKYGDFKSIDTIIKIQNPTSSFNYPNKVCNANDYLKPIHVAYENKHFKCVEQMYKSQWFEENDSLDKFK